MMANFRRRQDREKWFVLLANDDVEQTLG